MKEAFSSGRAGFMQDPKCGWRLAWLLACGVAGLLAVCCHKSPAPATAEAAQAPEPQRRVLFDDFDYADPKQMGDNGWTLRTAPGAPGIDGATWWKEGVSFAQDDTDPQNRLLKITSSTSGDGPSTRQTQLCHQRKYLEGTYAARIRFSDAPAFGPDGDQIVETFYAIAPPSDPRFGEIDFEYLANGGWEKDGEHFWVTTWAPWGKVRTKPEDAEFEHDHFSSTKAGSFEGWRVLVARVTGGRVQYAVDGRQIATHGDGYYPEVPLSINFNLWFVEEGLADSTEPREYAQYVDWVYFEANAVLTMAQVSDRVAELRREKVRFRDTVPSWDPPLPSLCDL